MAYAYEFTTSADIPQLFPSHSLWLVFPSCDHIKESNFDCSIIFLKSTLN